MKLIQKFEMGGYNCYLFQVENIDRLIDLGKEYGILDREEIIKETRRNPDLQKLQIVIYDLQNCNPLGIPGSLFFDGIEFSIINFERKIPSCRVIPLYRKEEKGL
jgi:hypothetical protein